MIQDWEKVILIILEILGNYYGIESRVGIETLRTIFKMPRDYLIFYCLSLDFCGISRQTTRLMSYGFLWFTAWLVYAKELSGSTV